MPYVNVPNDLSKIKTKIAFNLTKRQLICFGMGAAIGVPTYLLTRQAIGNTGALFVMLAIMLPAFLLAIYYNCIGAFDVPDRRKIPEADIIMETRKGVALSYAPEQVAV